MPGKPPSGLQPEGPRAPSGGSALPRGLLRLNVEQATAAQLVLSTRDGRRFVAPQTDPPLTPGTRIQARVVQAGRLPVLEILPRLEASLFLDRIRRHPGTPSPLPLRDLLRPLSTVGRNPALLRMLPERIRTRLAAFLARLPDPQELSSPDGLRQALRDSGLFLEAKVAQAIAGKEKPSDTIGASGMVRNDPGLALHRLAAAIRGTLKEAAGHTTGSGGDGMDADMPDTLLPSILQRLPEADRKVLLEWLRLQSPPAAGRLPVRDEAARLAAASPRTLLERRLLDAVEELLGRLHQRQLHFVEQRERGHFDLLVDLPVRRDDFVHPWQLQIRREQKDDPESGRSRARDRWLVRLDLDLPVLGKLLADIALELPGRSIEIHFRAERDDTVSRLRKALPALSDRLREQALEPSGLSVRRGRIEDSGMRITAASRQLLDEKA